MLDNFMRERILPALDDIGTALSEKGIAASQVTVAAFIIACLSGLAIWAAAWWTALLLLVLSRLVAGVDSALVACTV